MDRAAVHRGTGSAVQMRKRGARRSVPDVAARWVNTDTGRIETGRDALELLRLDVQMRTLRMNDAEGAPPRAGVIARVESDHGERADPAGDPATPRSAAGVDALGTGVQDRAGRVAECCGSPTNCLGRPADLTAGGLGESSADHAVP